MTRHFTDSRLVLASHNTGKVSELGLLLAPLRITVSSAGDLGLPEPEETADSFAGNAGLKALAAAQGSGYPAIADDSGLVVDALGGQPGIYSARWAGPDRDFMLAMQRVNNALLQIEQATGAVVDRRARFVCALSLAWPDGHIESLEGRVEGRLVWPPRGEKGFGYDPVFVPRGLDLTFAEMKPEEKHAMSHRAVAFAALCATVLAPDPASVAAPGRR